MAPYTWYSYLPGLQTSPLFGCYLADVRHHLLLNFRILNVYFLKLRLTGKVLIKQIFFCFRQRCIHLETRKD